MPAFGVFFAHRFLRFDPLFACDFRICLACWRKLTENQPETLWTIKVASTSQDRSSIKKSIQYFF